MADRQELHYRILILKEMMDEGKIHFVKDLHVIESLKLVKIAADGLVDESTVDSSVRALLLAVTYLHNRQELKTISLIDVQKAYFDLLEDVFGDALQLMEHHNSNPHKIAQFLANQPETVKYFIDHYNEFSEHVLEFWENAAPILYAHLEDAETLKSVFGGDIFPSYVKNIASSVGLYVDTIILPDPLLRTIRMAVPMKPEALVYYTFKHALNVLQYKELALADIDPPIVVVSPDFAMLEKDMFEYVHINAEEDITTHLSKIFGINFTNIDDAYSFVDTLHTMSDPLARFQDPDRFLIDIDWTGSLEDKIKRHMNDTKRDFDRIMLRNLGNLVKTTVMGRMLQANDIVFASSRYKGLPLVDAPTSWQYLLWKYEYDVSRGKADTFKSQDLLITRALEVEGNKNILMISNLPVKALIELRRTDALGEMREIIRKGIEKIDAVSEDSFQLVAESVTNNFDEAFRKHQRELQDISKSRKRFYGVDVARFVGLGGLQIAAAASGNPLLAIFGVVTGMISSPPLAKDLMKQWKENRLKETQLKKSPVGILVRYSNK